LAQEYDISAYLTKPARSSLLLETLVSAMQSSKLRTQTPEGATGEGASRLAEMARKMREQEASAAGLEAKPASAGNEGGQLDILVAEDNEVNQMVFSQILESLGVKFRIVGNGRLAVESHRAFNPRAILMDVSMPDMNGLEATRAIRENEAATGAHTPIIGVTAHALKGDRERCMEAGMDDYLSKPVSPDKLSAIVKRWMDKVEAA
jgi:CheY-like chemotaxis protein